MAKKQSAGIDILFSKKGIIESINFSGATNNAERTSLLILLVGQLCSNISSGLKGEELVIAVSKGLDKNIGELYDGNKSKTGNNRPKFFENGLSREDARRKEQHDLVDAILYAERRKNASERNKESEYNSKIGVLVQEVTTAKKIIDKMFDEVIKFKQSHK